MVFQVMIYQSLITFILGVFFVQVLNSKTEISMRKNYRDISPKAKIVILCIFMIFVIFMDYATLYAYVLLSL